MMGRTDTSAAAYAGIAPIADHLRDWIKGINGRGVSMAIFGSRAPHAAGRYRWLSSSPTERRASIALHLTRSCRDVGKTVVCYKANGGARSPRGPNVK